MIQSRPQLIEFNGELILDPAYMHTYALDERMFGAQAQEKNAEAAEKAAFARALANAAKEVPSKKAKSQSREPGSVPPEMTLIPTAGSSDSSELARAIPGLIQDTPANEAGPSASSSATPAPEPKSATSVPNDGLLRVRICSVKNCHNPVPIDYHWKMCEPCRELYRMWSVQKRARKRERRMQVSRPFLSLHLVSLLTRPRRK